MFGGLTCVFAECFEDLNLASVSAGLNRRFGSLCLSEVGGRLSSEAGGVSGGGVAGLMGVRSCFARCPHLKIEIWGTRRLDPWMTLLREGKGWVLRLCRRWMVCI
jgi:hypothetical protein